MYLVSGLVVLSSVLMWGRRGLLVFIKRKAHWPL